MEDVRGLTGVGSLLFEHELHELNEFIGTMIRKQDFFNIECDHCGAMLDEENWWDDKETCESLLTECNWKKLGDRQYCDECWEYDDDDNIVTKDGRKWTENGEEIK